MNDLTNTLYQYYTREHMEKNLDTTISEEKWEWFLDECGTDFANACGDLATELWEENEHDYQEND